MSTDNYLWIEEDGSIYEGSASSDELPTYQIHRSASIKDAVVWADEYCRTHIVEYGYGLSEDARRLLKDGT